MKSVIQPVLTKQLRMMNCIINYESSIYTQLTVIFRDKIVYTQCDFEFIILAATYIPPAILTRQIIIIYVLSSFVCVLNVVKNVLFPLLSLPTFRVHTLKRQYSSRRDRGYRFFFPSIHTQIIAILTFPMPNTPIDLVMR